MTPESVIATSMTKYWWRCKKGHVYQRHHSVELTSKAVAGIAISAAGKTSKVNFPTGFLNEVHASYALFVRSAIELFQNFVRRAGQAWAQALHQLQRFAEIRIRKGRIESDQRSIAKPGKDSGNGA